MPVIENPVGLQLDEIVVATDFKPEAEAATEYARALARHFSSKLMVAHVVDLSVATRCETAVAGFAIDEMRREAAENMERTLNALNCSGVRAYGKVLEAHNPASAVVDLSDEIGAKMIVMGTQAKQGLNRMIVGSCAEGVVHHARCPVVTLGPKVKRAATHAIRIKTIVFATDLKHDTAEKAGIALSFAQDSIAKVYLCHVLEREGRDFGETIELQLQAESALRRLIPNSAYEWCSPESIVEYGSVAEHILQLAKKTSADLVVLGARRSATWFTHLSAGVVGRVLTCAECPVMTICSE